MKIIGYTLGVLIGLALVLGVAALLLWWLVPLAFPGLAFGFWNAVPLAAILLLFSTSASFKD